LCNHVKRVPLRVPSYATTNVDRATFVIAVLPMCMNNFVNTTILSHSRSILLVIQYENLHRFPFSKKSLWAIFRARGGHYQLCTFIYVRHLQSFNVPVIPIILDYAQRIDPDVVKFQFTSKYNCVLKVFRRTTPLGGIFRTPIVALVALERFNSPHSGLMQHMALASVLVLQFGVDLWLH
jgi:hypothetical protein